MNYQSWTQRKFALVLGAVLLAGMIISPKGTDSQIADSNVQVMATEAVKEVRAENAETLRQLDAIDQEIFEQSGQVIDAQTNALSVAGDILARIDTITVDEIDAATVEVLEEHERIKTATIQVEKLQQEREALLAD